MKIIMIFGLNILIMISMFTSMGYCQFEWQNPLPQGNSLLDLTVLNEMQAIAVGHSGSIIKTEDGGVNWEFVRTDMQCSFYDLFFVDHSMGWAVGSSGTILKTTDGGNNWFQQASANDKYVFIHDIFFINQHVGWNTYKENNIYSLNKSIDGGDTWFSLGTFSEILTSLYFISENVGFLTSITYDTHIYSIHKTVDGGKTWTVVDKSNFEHDLLESIIFLNENIGWAVGNQGKVLKTVDGGNTWSRITAFPKALVESIHFIDEHTGWITTVGHGKILKSIDGGNTWEIQYNNSRSGFSSIRMANSKTAWAVGTSILKTTNGGDDWVNQMRGTTDRLYSVDFLNKNTGYVGGWNGTILKTIDGGRNWEKLNVPSEYTIKALDFFTENTGWAVSDMGAIFLTTDGGQTWKVDETSYFLNSLHVVDSQVVYTVGFSYQDFIQKGVILKTSDGGTSWHLQFMDTDDYFTAVYFYNTNNGWVVGDHGVVLRTRDGGNHWYLTNIEEYITLNDVFFINNHVGWTVGRNGKVWLTLDGGINWMLQYYNNQGSFNAIQFIDSRTGYISSSGAIALFGTTDRGNSWKQIPTLTSNNLLNLHFVDINHGWLVGWKGTILKYENNVLSVLKNTPNSLKGFELTQNYPNPFNPQTEIVYKVKNKCNITLIIYNMQGQYIATLVEGSYEPGSYKVTFDGSGLTSGVYLYRLQAGDYHEVKKMILLE